MGKRILIVEDDQDEIFFMLKNLNKLFHDLEVMILIAETFSVAEKAIKEKHFDLVSTDGQFPWTENGPPYDQAGLRFLHLLNEKNYAGPVILYSGNEEVVEEASRVTVSGHPVFARIKSCKDYGVRISTRTWASKVHEFLVT